MVELYLTLIGLTWLVTLGGGETKSALGIWKLHLQRCQVRKWKTGVNQSVIHVTPLSTLTQFFLYAPLLISSPKIYS